MWGEDRQNTQTKIEQNAVKQVEKKTADNATLAADIRRKGLIILDGLLDDFAQVRATEHRVSKKGVTDVKRLRDLTQAFRDLTDDMQTNTGQENELLASLMELERRSEA